MSDWGPHWGIAAMVIALGFAAAGFTAALFRALHQQNAAFHAKFATLGQAFWSLLLCSFAGPFIILSGSLAHWRAGALPTPVFGAAALLCGVWSFCSGVVLVQLLLLAGIITAS